MDYCDIVMHFLLPPTLGTGTSCIYPLLGCKMNGWRFLATDIDSEAVKFAIENVKRNGFTDKIEGTNKSAWYRRGENRISRLKISNIHM